MKLVKKDYNLTFIQMVVLKVALLSGGIIIGSYFSEYLSKYLFAFVVIWFLGAIYIIWKQIK